MSDQIDEKQVRHVAHLSRLKLTDEEVRRFGTQLNAVIDYMQQLNELDTDNVEPTAHPLPIRNVFRSDEPKQTFGPNEALANAPDKVPPYFKVPKVLDQQSA